MALGTRGRSAGAHRNRRRRFIDPRGFSLTVSRHEFPVRVCLTDRCAALSATATCRAIPRSEPARIPDPPSAAAVKENRVVPGAPVPAGGRRRALHRAAENRARQRQRRDRNHPQPSATERAGRNQPGRAGRDRSGAGNRSRRARCGAGIGADCRVRRRRGNQRHRCGALHHHRAGHPPGRWRRGRLFLVARPRPGTGGGPMDDQPGRRRCHDPPWPRC